jgi:CRP-like cAMP-binding protein
MFRRLGQGLLAPMPASKRMVVKNRILSMLANTEYRRLRPSLEQVALHTNEVLYAPGDVVRHIYFPNDAVVSLLFDVDQRRTVEVAMEGNEGAVGLAVYLGGVNSCNLSIVRDAGTAMRVEVNVLRRCGNQRGRLQGLLHRSVHAFVTQIAQSGVCNRFHNIDERLARWLLMTQDRVGSPKLRATQESIARMLGVRRSSVTAAASGFHKQNMIEYCRGRIEILDQRRLRAASCSCYGIMKRQYDSFLN